MTVEQEWNDYRCLVTTFDPPTDEEFKRRKAEYISTYGEEAWKYCSNEWVSYCNQTK